MLKDPNPPIAPLRSATVLILLPPSEGKAARGDGPALDLPRLSFPALGSPREIVLNALTALCREPAARDVLGLSPGRGR